MNTPEYIANIDELTRRNAVFISEILLSQRAGLSCLPDELGLPPAEFSAMMAYFQKYLPSRLTKPYETLSESGAIRQDLLELREQEWLDIKSLLLEHCNCQDISEIWLAQIIAAACLGGSHLWRDLGLSSRQNLRDLLQQNFTSLYQLNNKDMRWKKFFYRQLCEQEGHYICRSPSCESCSTYDECFGEEL